MNSRIHTTTITIMARRNNIAESLKKKHSPADKSIATIFLSCQAKTLYLPIFFIFHKSLLLVNLYICLWVLLIFNQ